MHESKPDRLPVGQKLSEAWGRPVIVGMGVIVMLIVLAVLLPIIQLNQFAR